MIVYITLSGRNSNLILCHKLHKSLAAGLCTKTFYIETYSRRSYGASFYFRKARDFVMKEFWNMIQLIFTAMGGWLGYFLGGCDGLLIALVLFAVVDYLTGIMCAVADKKLSSHVGFKGICRKVLIFLLVGIANIIDVQVIGTGSVIRTAVIFFYLSNEGVSILENAAHLGLPIPEALKAALAQIHDRASDTDGKDGDE